MVKAIRVSTTRTSLDGKRYENQDTAVLRDAEEFAQFFARRYGMGKGQKKAMAYAFGVLIGWKVETIDY